MPNIQFTACNFICVVFFSVDIFSRLFVCFYIDRVIRARTSSMEKTIADEMRKKPATTETWGSFFQNCSTTKLHCTSFLICIKCLFAFSLLFAAMLIINQRRFLCDTTLFPKKIHISDYATKFRATQRILRDFSHTYTVHGSWIHSHSYSVFRQRSKELERSLKINSKSQSKQTDEWKIHSAQIICIWLLWKCFAIWIMLWHGQTWFRFLREELMARALIAFSVGLQRVALDWGVLYKLKQ